VDRLANPRDQWQELVDLLRPEIHRIWKAWSTGEKKRFLRHVRRLWDVHRHRVSPELIQAWAGYVSAGKISVLAGRLESNSLSADENTIDAKISLLEGHSRHLQVNRVINCTGAVPDTSLLESSDLEKDPLGLGIITNEVGNLIRKDGRSIESVFVLGPSLRPYFWEMTAVPELRVQSARIVEVLILQS
jgi:uncharacterized NAD(P)/FAD-binding protein YdhS